ncbi:MAG: hypothetical protein J7K30_05170 [Deltaproteobacteria bacterium]|nr:hypothetical protein [Deltaproteobacteria bacterium]
MDDFLLIKKMDRQSPLEKRIKRHVAAREHLFFAATTPGFKSVCFKELFNIHGSIKEISMVNGGVEFKGRLQDCYKANLFLRTANRILMRIGKLKATNFRILEKKLTNFPWELFIPDINGNNSQPEISVTSIHSRLYHKTAVAECFRKCITNRFNNVPGCQAGNIDYLQQHLFVRIQDDNVIISLDSSGELLHKRGVKKYKTRAPIRETIASAALMLAGYEAGEPLIDPLCGSGTFSIEGAMLSSNIPAGWFREFAFMGWPCFKTEQWAYIKREAEKKILLLNEFCVFASDIDDRHCRRLDDTLKLHKLSSIVRVENKDFFRFSPSHIFKHAGTVAINPPYGLRLGNKNESIKLLGNIINKLLTSYAGWKYALVVPRNSVTDNVLSNSSSHQFCHGGLDMILFTGKVS